MMQIHRIAILAPLAAGLVAVICTIMIHALPLSATVDFVRRERKLGRAGTNFWIDMGIVVLTARLTFLSTTGYISKHVL